MYEKLKELLSKDRDEVINSALILDLLKIYSKIYLNSKPCAICTKLHIKYYDRLKREGLAILKRMAEQQFILKDNKVIHDWETGRTYTKYDMTDEYAIARLRKFPKRIDEAEKYPENWQDIVNGITDEKKQEQKVLSSMTVRELKALAEEKNIEIPKGSKKQDIINLLNEA